MIAFSIDQIVIRIGEEGRSAMRCGPPRRRIGWCNELGRHLGRGAEYGIIEDGQILLDGAACRVRRQTRGTFDTGAVAGIGLDQTGINREAFTTDQPSSMQRCNTVSNSRRSRSLCQEP